jgi:hypothetical protein
MKIKVRIFSWRYRMRIITMILNEMMRRIDVFGIGGIKK